MLVEFINPITLDVALAVQQELHAQLEEGDRLRGQQVERARYEAELAQRRYMRVDPDNRLVADSLEADWNQKLKLLADTQQERKQLRERGWRFQFRLLPRLTHGWVDGGAWWQRVLDSHLNSFHRGRIARGARAERSGTPTEQSSLPISSLQSPSTNSARFLCAPQSQNSKIGFDRRPAILVFDH